MVTQMQNNKLNSNSTLGEIISPWAPQELRMIWQPFNSIEPGAYRKGWYFRKKTKLYYFGKVVIIITVGSTPDIIFCTKEYLDLAKKIANEIKKVKGKIYSIKVRITLKNNLNKER